MKNENKSGIQVCPGCGFQIEVHVDVEKTDNQPRKNDLCVCTNCGEWYKYNNKLKLIPFTAEEKLIIKKDEMLFKTMNNISEQIKITNKLKFN